jgi:hypothetical protein
MALENLKQFLLTTCVLGPQHEVPAYALKRAFEMSSRGEIHSESVFRELMAQLSPELDIAEKPRAILGRAYVGVGLPPNLCARVYVVPPPLMIPQLDDVKAVPLNQLPPSRVNRTPCYW